MKNRSKQHLHLSNWSASMLSPWHGRGSGPPSGQEGKSAGMCGRERGDEHARSRNNATVGISGVLWEGAGTRALRPGRVAQAAPTRRRRKAVTSSRYTASASGSDRRSGFLRPRQWPSLASAAGCGRGASAEGSPRWRPARRAVIPGFPGPGGGLAAAARPDRIRPRTRTAIP